MEHEPTIKYLLSPVANVSKQTSFLSMKSEPTRRDQHAAQFRPRETLQNDFSNF